ncbi:MAG: DNA methyltransferase [Candidatus Nanoarchaeia archaeon]|nr:DNA methyltransferase [Candidatus Nanoarchaeia archaeon]
MKKEEPHRFICGDCLEVMKNFPSDSVDLIFTDPPYNQNIPYVKKDFKDRKKPEEYLDWLKERLKEVHRILKDTGSLYIMNYPELNARILPFLEDELEMHLRRWIVWHYPTNVGHSKKNWTRSHRSILFLTKGKDYTFNRSEIIQPYKNPEVSKVRIRLENGSKGRGAYDTLDIKDLLELFELKGRPTDIIKKNLLKNVRKERKKWHACQLPPELIEIFIRVSSNPGNLVLDPFAGTFTTSMVAKKLNRKSIGIDISKKYVRYGKSRLKE